MYHYIAVEFGVKYFFDAVEYDNEYDKDKNGEEKKLLFSNLFLPLP